MGAVTQLTPTPRGRDSGYDCDTRVLGRLSQVIHMPTAGVWKILKGVESEGRVRTKPAPKRPFTEPRLA